MILHRPSRAFRSGRTCVDLFAGAGGLAVGFRQAGWSIVAANDADAKAGETFRLNFPETAFFEGPIASLDAKAILRACGLRRGELDCLIGGPPCQSFSYNNHQRSAVDARARLFEDYLRLVKGLRPKTLVMENVPGILTIGGGRVIRTISSRLKALGYDSFVKMLSADDFGVPQIRKRVFIVASRVGTASELLPSLDSSKPIKRVTVHEAIGDLPVLRIGGGSQTSKPSAKKPKSNYQKEARKRARKLFNHVCNGLTPPMVKRIKYVPEAGNWRDIPFRLLTAGMKRAHPSDHTKRYGRLSRKGLASTILTKCDPHWGAYIHPTQDRTISVREAARLQGFPDTFRFAGDSVGPQYSQVGNAVPVQLARAIASSVRKHVGKRKRTARKPAKTLPASHAQKQKKKVAAQNNGQNILKPRVISRSRRVLRARTTNNPQSPQRFGARLRRMVQRITRR
jgi:DNA (cytosine-5)-methyltransferase 1